MIVDEAWYGHARFHPALRPTALESGADYCTQSTHKVLSAFSQASMIHVNDPLFDEHLFRENFNMHASTSPQYNLIASLDVARKQAVMEGYRLLDRSLKYAQELREKINATGVFRALELADLLPEELADDGIRLDPTKITIDITASGFSSDELREELFERFNIQVEKSTHNTLTLLLTVGTTRSKVSRLFDALLRLSKERRPERASARMPELPRFSRLACLPRDAFYEYGERIPLARRPGPAQRRARRPRVLRPDHAVPAGHSRAGAGPGGHARDHRLPHAHHAHAEVHRDARPGHARRRAVAARAGAGRARGDGQPHRALRLSSAARAIRRPMRRCIPQWPPFAVFGAVLITGYLGAAIGAHVRIGQGAVQAIAAALVIAAVVWSGLWLRDARVRALTHAR